MLFPFDSVQMTSMSQFCCGLVPLLLVSCEGPLVASLHVVCPILIKKQDELTLPLAFNVLVFLVFYLKNTFYKSLLFYFPFHIKVIIFFRIWIFFVILKI